MMKYLEMNIKSKTLSCSATRAALENKYTKN